MRYIRLDDLSAVELNSWEVLWGPKCDAVKVRKSHLTKFQYAGKNEPPPVGAMKDYRVPHMSISANWAVRLVDANSLEARAARIAYLIARDGGECFYCGCQILTTTADLSPYGMSRIGEKVEVEHIIPVAHGGPDHASNLCLSCPPCNRAMGALSGVEKVKLAIKMRLGTVH